MDFCRVIHDNPLYLKGGFLYNGAHNLGFIKIRDASRTTSLFVIDCWMLIFAWDYWWLATIGYSTYIIRRNHLVTLGITEVRTRTQNDGLTYTVSKSITTIILTRSSYFSRYIIIIFHTDTFICIPGNINAYKFSFFLRIITDWNGLPVRHTCFFGSSPVMGTEPVTCC